ncbi:hypothetical protein QTI66_28760 [Variovorax sp. J22R133]|uniref:hypothetical protein n=1 Tax=Variovorax brevis TaxID=3053503 RepID=UPI00257735E2|nr:hypothetical protein [Variovorax sp. J22R133]MDM0116163.1 hypothetical protein [Variovorax sp. J22R133]
MNQPTPAIVAQSAVRRLPRIPLLLLCAAYLMPGLLGRGPWKSADIVSFGYMLELAQSNEGLARWFDPLLFGLRPETLALIPYWVGAWAIQIAPSWINPDLAVRIVFAFFLWGAFSATWYAVYHFARTPRAQPVAFAFGGEAHPTDYARAIADGGLMALIATLGLAQLGHETTPALAQLFFAACMFYGMAALPYRLVGPGMAMSLGVIGMALSGGPTVALILGAGCVVICAEGWRRRLKNQPDDYDTEDESATYTGMALVIVAVSTVVAGVLAFSLGLVRWQIDLPGSHPGTTLAGEARSLMRLLIWFTWPAWPLTLWTLWRWRRQLTARHVAVPLWFVLVPLAATLTTDFSQRSLLLALPALATLAAFALPTFRRSASALIDWFTLLFFSGSAVIIWVIYIAMQTGFPAKPAANVAKLAPGFVPEFSAVALVFAIAATIAWAWVVRWRTGRHRAALWKTLVLPAGGAALCWMLVMTLWLPPLDYARSYIPQIRAVSTYVGRPDCVSALGLSRAHIVALRYHGQITLQPLTPDSRCRWALVNPDVIERLHDIVSLDQWRLIRTLRRPTASGDDLLLYQRLTP